jgi:hypothetical protein
MLCGDVSGPFGGDPPQTVYPEIGTPGRPRCVSKGLWCIKNTVLLEVWGGGEITRLGGSKVPHGLCLPVKIR